MYCNTSYITFRNVYLRNFHCYYCVLLQRKPHKFKLELNDLIVKYLKYHVQYNYYHFFLYTHIQHQ